MRYEKWLAWKQKDESDSHAAADGRIYNSKKMPGVAATTTTETPAMPATKQSTMETNRMTTSPAQGMRRKAIPAERQDVAIGGREGINCTIIKDCVVDGNILHDIETRPSYASILKKGGTGVRGYALAAIALSGVPATYKIPSSEQAPAKRSTCDPNKLYQDGVATYHGVFVIRYLKNVRGAGRTIRGNCNGGVKLCCKVGDLCIFKMWVNEGGIANLLSIPQLEKDGFIVTSDTNGEWIVYLPRGEELFFKRDAGNLKNMPYIEMGNIVKAFAHANIEADQDIKAIQERKIETVCMKMKDFSRAEVKEAIAARKAQIMLAHPPDTKFKQLVTSDSVKNCPVTA